MSLYLRLKVNGFAPIAGIVADFNVEYRTSLPNYTSDLDFYTDLLAKISTNAWRAETRFEIYNGRDELFVHYAKLLVNNEDPSVYIRTPMMTKLISADKENLAAVLRDTIRKILESANAILDGKIPSPVIKTPTKEE